MTNLEKYNQAFRKTFDVAEKDLPALQYGKIAAWDSAGHMILIAEIEDTFKISLAIADIMNFDSYGGGLEILQKNYGVEF